MRDSWAPQIKIAFVLRGWGWCSDQTALFKETAAFCSPVSESVFILNNWYTCQSLLETRIFADHWLKPKLHQKAIRSAKQKIRYRPTNEEKKKDYQVPAGRKIPITKTNCSKHCLCRTDIFIKHLPSRADALQNSQLMREHGTGRSGVRCQTEQSCPVSHIWGENPETFPITQKILWQIDSHLCKSWFLNLFFYKMNHSNILSSFHK